MSLEQIIEQLRFSLVGLRKVDLGYPLGENDVRPPLAKEDVLRTLSSISECATTHLHSLYCACNGASLPDVNIGYFIDSLERLVKSRDCGDVHTIVAEQEIAVQKFGSTGGGDLFVVDCDLGIVYALAPGPVHAGRYGRAQGTITRAADSVQHFCELLVTDVDAFLRNDLDHRYLGAR